jgi:hypothetical protein
LTACGGSPANGRHGIPLPPAKIRAPAARVINSNAVEASSTRRLGTLADGLAFRLTGPHNEALTGAEFADMAFPSLICGVQAIADRAFAIELTTHLDPNRVNSSKISVERWGGWRIWPPIRPVGFSGFAPCRPQMLAVLA